MSLSLRWVGREHATVVGRVRGLCYAAAEKEVAVFQQRLSTDGRLPADDILLAERDGHAVGTATAYPMTMWVRGGRFACQGVGYVGTVRTHRRSSGDGARQPGVATQIMNEMIRRGREKGDVLSALMPFRATFYEHFGYGLVERRITWTVPLSILPAGPCNGFRFITGADDARRACRQRMVEAGQCDIERTPGSWEWWTAQEGEGYVVADQPGGPGAPACSWAAFTQKRNGAGKDVVTVEDQAWDSPEALRRLLCFFSTLRDQVWALAITLPADVQLFRLLKEPQVPHRQVNHETADARAFTRMQVRVLDHVKLVNGMKRLPPDVRGKAVVEIQETEGHRARLRIEIEDGRAAAAPTAESADVELPDRHWAAVLTGDLTATAATNLGLVHTHRAAALPVLDAFSAGPVPFCNEYF